MNTRDRTPRRWVRVATALLAACVAVPWLRLIVREFSPTGQLVREVRQGDADDRLLAIIQLGLSSRDYEVDRVVEALVEALDDEDDRVRNQAALTLHTILLPLNQRRGRVPEGWTAPHPETVEAAVAALLDATDDPSREVRLHALLALEKTPPDSPRVETVIARLGRASRDPDPAVRVISVQPLATLGASRESAASALIALMGDESEELRASAVAVVGHLRGDDGGKLFPVVLAGLRDASSRVRSEARSAASFIPNPPLSAARDLMDLLKESAAPPGEALALLDGAGPVSWGPIGLFGPAIERAARDEARNRRGQRRWFTETIGHLLHNMGPGALALVPDLDAALGEAVARGDDPMFLATAWALAGIAPDSPAGRRAVAALIETLRSSPEGTMKGGWSSDMVGASQYDLVNVLSSFGRFAEPALPLIRERSQDDPDAVRWQIERIEQALAEAGSIAPPDAP